MTMHDDTQPDPGSPENHIGAATADDVGCGCDAVDLATRTTAGPTRRQLLAGAAALAGAAGVAGVFGGALGGPAGPAGPLGSAAAAATPRRGRGKLVVVFLRGGIDGLTAVVPAADSAYYAARPTIAVPAEASLQLDGSFGLHPAMAPLHGLWQDGRLAIVNAVGNPARSRSHFDAQDLLEQGSATRRSDAAGWLTRYLTTTTSGAPHGGLFRAVAISGGVPGSLRGSNALAIPAIGSFGLGGRTGASGSWAGVISQMYEGRLPVEAAGKTTVQAVTTVRGVTPPTTSSAFTEAAALLGAGLGVEVVTVDTGGWDTHDNMGTHSLGQMRNLLAGLAGGLAGLQADLDARGLSEVTTVVMSEFGRRLLENGSGGTDHGMANMMLVMGGAVRGGRVLGAWPGLAAANLDRGDLAITTDVRDVLWELTRDVLGHPDPAAVFPGHAHTTVGVAS